MTKPNIILAAVARSQTLFRFLRWLHRFDEHPHHNRFGAGLYQLLWARYCGYDWKHARKMAAIYWFPGSVEEMYAAAHAAAERRAPETAKLFFAAQDAAVEAERRRVEKLERKPQ
jgi:hypothetical protein